MAVAKIPNQVNAKYIPSLDGWRGVAILAVMLWHLWPLETGHPSALVSFGWMGVDLFFVLSGFLITRILLTAKGKPHFFRNFYARRVLRIFPLYYGTVFVVYLIWPAIRHHEWFHLYGLIADLAAVTHLTNLYTARSHQWFPAPYPFGAAHLWSLAIEEQFYLFWPLVVWMTDRGKVFWASVALAAVSIVCRLAFWWEGIDQIVPYVFTLSRLDGLAAGAAVAAISQNPLWVRQGILTARWLAPLSASGLILIGVLNHSLDIHLHDSVRTLGLTLCGPLFASLILLSVGLPARNWLDWFADRAPLRFVGKYSYGLYLYHGYLIIYFQLILWPRVVQQLGDSFSVRFGAFLIEFLACLALAVVSYHIFEQPILRLKRFFPEPMSPDRATDYR